MTPGQTDLRAQAARRLRASRPDLADAYDLESCPDLAAAHRRIAEIAGEVDSVVVVVLRSPDLPTWVRDTCEFSLGLTAEAARDWRRALTRTVFLSGNPENLRERFPFEHVSRDGSAAWFGPTTARDAEPLRRLLKLFDGPVTPPTSPAVVVDLSPGAGSRERPPIRRDLYVATARTTVAAVLVALNHLLAEAVLDHLLTPGDQIVIRCVPRLVGVPYPFAALRVELEPGCENRLTAYAGLSEAQPPGHT